MIIIIFGDEKFQPKYTDKIYMDFCLIIFPLYAIIKRVRVWFVF